jgi:ketosteroid isomerase-like protein
VNEPRSSAERVYELLGAYQQGDEEKLRSLIHPEGEVRGAPGLLNEGTFYGYDGFREWLGQWEEAWEEINYEPGEVIEVDERLIVVPVHTVGVGAGSGMRIDAVFGWLYEWRGELTTRFHVYPDVDSALEAAKQIAAEET